MTRHWKAVNVLVLAAGVVWAVGAAAKTHAGARNQPSSGWRDDFSSGQIDATRWVVGNGQAPGYIPYYHIGYYDPTHVSVADGYLVMLLTQENGTVDETGQGVISRGGLLYTRQTYGYGTYEWRMRMSSTSTTSEGDGNPESGSVSAGFLYVNNSQTEIDFEFSGLNPSTLWLVSWLNPNPKLDPTGANETYTAVQPFDSTSSFHTYKFVWQRGKITYYIDGVLKAVHKTNVPKAPAYFMINHWGTDGPNWGGTASVGVSRYFYVDWVSYTPQ
jgi:endo-1,3-1,4-beta-glycanase ExoK